MRKPFFRESRKCWFVKDDRGRFIRLDPDEEKAFALWQRMRELANFQHSSATLESILEAYLRDLEPKVSPARFLDCVRVLDGFAVWHGPTRMARTVTASDVLRWVRLKRDIGEESRQWSIARQRDAGRVAKNALSWAIRRGYIPWSDVTELEFARPLSRSLTIDFSMHCRFIADCQSQPRSRPFALLLIALRHTGARPIQIREATAANVVNASWVFRVHKTSAKTGKPLIVRLSPCLHTLSRILAHHRPSGALFRTSQGKPWTKDGTALRFRRMRERLGIAEPVTAYSYRHSFATDALQAGIDVSTVAALLGHTDSSMVARVYGHLDQRSTHLQDAIGKLHDSRSKKP
jgi:integrase